VTSQILFDRLAYVGRLKAGSFTEQQARAAADALGEALVETVATKADITSVKADIVRSRPSWTPGSPVSKPDSAVSKPVSPNPAQASSNGS
jgi:hypothetical protein